MIYVLIGGAVGMEYWLVVAVLVAGWGYAVLVVAVAGMQYSGCVGEGGVVASVVCAVAVTNESAAVPFSGFASSFPGFPTIT